MIGNREQGDPISNAQVGKAGDADAPETPERSEPERQDTPTAPPLISEQAFVDRMRRSDRWMIALTAAVALAGIASAAIFWMQLSAMRGQLAEMKAARTSSDTSTAASLAVLQAQAAALKETNRISEENLTSQERAWLWLYLDVDNMQLDQGIRPQIAIKYFNSGHEPAQRITMGFRAEMSEINERARLPETDTQEDWRKAMPVWTKHADEFEWRGLCNEPVQGNPAIFPGQPGMYINVDGSLVDMRKVRKRTTILMVLGCASYFTAGATHYSTGCWWLMPVKDEPITAWVWKGCFAANHDD